MEHSSLLAIAEGPRFEEKNEQGERGGQGWGEKGGVKNPSPSLISLISLLILFPCPVSP